MKKIDAHCHINKKEWVFYKDPSDFLIDKYSHTYDENQVLENMSKAGIDKTIIFPLPSICVDLNTANNYVLKLARQYPGKFIPFTIIDKIPEYWYDKGAKGFKEHDYGQRNLRNDKGHEIFSQDFKKSYKFMEEHGLPLILHAGTNRIERLKQDIFKDTPDLKIILAHLGADFPEPDYKPEIQQVKTTLEKLKHLPNLYFDISAIKNPEILKMAVDIVGPKKLIFGADFPEEKPFAILVENDSVAESYRRYFEYLWNIAKI